MAGQGDSIRAILFALGANFAIFVTKGIAALLGLIFALVAIGLAVLTGNPAWDAVEAAFKQRFAQVRWSFFEPDTAD